MINIVNSYLEDSPAANWFTFAVFLSKGRYEG